MAFFLIPHRWRWMLLLGASYLFYTSWNSKYIVVLLAMTAIGYVSGRLLEQQTHPTTRRFILSLSLLASLRILFFFKYFDLSNPALHAVFDQVGIGYGVYLVLPQ
jgi:alginate O-acetyltransferase complex protein AlgI